MKHSQEILIRPRITEKAGVSSEVNNSYVFEVEKTATKGSIAKAIKEVWKVTPVKVNIVRLPAKKIISKGKIGRGKEVKKAYVYLKKGDKIDLI